LENLAPQLRQASGFGFRNASPYTPQSLRGDRDPGRVWSDRAGSRAALDAALEKHEVKLTVAVRKRVLAALG
jgi:hypothetical protein